MTATADEGAPQLLHTGIPGLDDILRGGLARNRLYLVGGDPGSGKTTLAMQFLLAGARLGERCLFITLSESEEELRASAASHGWSLEGIKIMEVIASEQSLKPDARYTMFHPSEVELTETTGKVLAEAEQLKPARLVFDSMSELRLLAQHPLRHRRQVLALKQFFSRQQCTVLFIDDQRGDEADLGLYSIAHGVLSLERQSWEYGMMRRRLQVVKMRGREFREGYHDLLIRRGGVQVFPRLVAAEHKTPFSREAVKSGLESLDALLGGGLARGTSTLVIGPTGVGKTTLATRYVLEATAHGAHAAVYLFDETAAIFRERSEGLGMHVGPLMESGQLTVRQVDPAELSPGEFAHDVRRTVERGKTRIVLIDSLNGYLNSMPSERYLTLHLHELLTFLGQQGVTTLLVMAQHGLVGSNTQSPVDAGYLADAVLLLRYFEAAGEVRRAISVIKKRTGWHEPTIRELRFDAGKGITIGEPVREFQGVLAGSPVFVGNGPERERGEAKP